MYDVVLAGTEGSTEEREVLRESLGERLENSETNNGTKERGTESPTSLQTKIDVGSVDKGTTNTSDKHGTEGDDPVALLRKVIVGCKGVGDGTLIVIGILLSLDQVGVLFIEVV